MLSVSRNRYKANVFSSKRERTYEMLLQDMYDNYWSQTVDCDTGLRTNSGSIKLYGHQRKAQEQMVRNTLHSDWKGDPKISIMVNKLNSYKSANS